MGKRIPVDLGLVRAMREQGMTLSDVAERLRISYGALQRRTALAGIFWKRGPTYKKNRAEKVRGHVKQALYTWFDLLDARIEEETMPVHLRGRAAEIQAWLEATSASAEESTRSPSPRSA